MDFLKQHKTSIGIVVVVVIVLVVYGVYFTGDDEEGLVVTEAGTQSAVEGGEELLGLLNELRSLELDRQVFETDAFRSLVDFGVELTPRPVGRDNPFAPFGVSL